MDPSLTRQDRALAPVGCFSSQSEGCIGRLTDPNREPPKQKLGEAIARGEGRRVNLTDA
jgi:hypothetical protein